LAFRFACGLAVLPKTNEVRTVSTFEGGEGAYRGIKVCPH